MKENFLEFNINDHFHVKLHEKGYEHWYNKEFPHYKAVGYTLTMEELKAKVGNDGYVSFQAHEFIRIFADSFDNFTPIFDLIIRIHKSELDEIIE